MTADPRTQITYGVVSEIHCTPPGEPNAVWHNELRFDLGLSLLESALANFEAHDVDVIAVLGDLTHLADEESMQRVRRMLRSTGKPVIVMSGNHDITADHSSPREFQRYFTNAATCAPPLETVFAGKPVRLIGLSRSPETNGLSSLGAPLSTNGQLAIVMSHYPLLSLSETLHDAGLKHAGDLTDLEERTAQLAAMTGPAVVLHGHLHVRATIVARSALHLSFAALVEPPHECSIVHVTESADGAITIERTASSVHRFDADVVPVLSPDRETWRFVEGVWSLD